MSETITIIGKDQIGNETISVPIITEYNGETIQIADKNKRVKAILQAIEDGDPSEMFGKGSIFNLQTGEISYSKLPGLEKHWAWILPEFYTVFGEKGDYLGYKRIGKLIQIKEN